MDALIAKQGTSTRGYSIDIETATVEQQRYRSIIKTYEDSMQLVLMSVPVGADIPWERHPFSAQFIRIEAGWGTRLTPVCRVL